MSQVGSAVDALNFSSYTIWIRQPLNCTGDFFVETWPAAVGFKLVLRTVQFCAAAFADVGSFFPERIVLAREWHFGAFANDNLFFLWGKMFEVGLFFRN